MITLSEPIPARGKFLLTGSRALGNRIAKDVDFLCHSSQLIGSDWIIDDKGLAASKGIYDVILTDKHLSLQKLLEKYGKDYPYRNCEVLYILKAAHVHLPRRNWFKDISDYHYLRNVLSFGVIPISFWKNEIEEYKNELDEINKTHQMNLNVTKDKFFEDGVIKFIDHDILHDMFAHYNQPVYKKTQSSNAEVFCSKHLWDQLTEIERIRMVLEETYVIAAERFVIPKMVDYQLGKIRITPDIHMQIILNALKKVCTTLSSGWFRQYSINNYFEICNHIDLEYFKSVCDQIHRDGIIYEN